MHSSRMGTARRSTRLLGGVSPSACWDTHPPGVGLETPHGQTPQHPPWVWAWRPPMARPLNIPPGCGPGDPSCEQND